MSNNIKNIALGLAASTLLVGAAHAGGFSRGSANIGILLDEGSGGSASVTYVNPTRKDENGIDTAGSYFYIDAALAAQLGDAKCAATLAQPFGLNSDESQTMLAPENAISDTATSYELGATCAYGKDVGPVKAFIIGGVFHQTLTYEREYFAGPDTPLLSLSDSAFGYRFGVGVAKPEIALKASLVYRSAVNHDLTGSLSLATLLSPAFVTGNAVSQVTTPQSIKLSAQSGVAPGWLVFGSVEWTDWSVLQVNPVFVDGIPAASLNSGFSDGWTISGGIGHQLNEKISLAASITWDKGVSAPYAPAGGQKISASFGSLTFGLGGSYQVQDRVSLRAGVAYTALNGGTFFDLDDLDYKTYPSGYAISGNLALNVKF